MIEAVWFAAMRLRGLTVVVVGVVGLVFVSSASAGLRPHLSLTLPSQAEAGTASAVSWSASGVQRGASVALQRQVGTGRVWRTIVRLPRNGHGTAQVPPLGLGRYPLRLAALSSRGQTLASVLRILSVFGEVPLSKLVVGEPGRPFGPGGFVVSGTFATATSTFSYVFQAEPGAGLMSIKKEDSDCRSVHFEWVGRPARGLKAVGLTVLQESAEPVAASVPPDVVGTLDASLVPGQSWVLNGTGEDSANEGTYIYVNGHASCDGLNLLINDVSQ